MRTRLGVPCRDHGLPGGHRGRGDRPRDPFRRRRRLRGQRPPAGDDARGRHGGVARAAATGSPTCRRTTTRTARRAAHGPVAPARGGADLAECLGRARTMLGRAQERPGEALRSFGTACASLAGGHVRRPRRARRHLVHRTRKEWWAAHDDFARILPTARNSRTARPKNASWLHRFAHPRIEWTETFEA